MKRLILMGGRPWLGQDKGERFVQTLFRYYPKEVKLAFCIFAQPESDWEETRQWNVGMFEKYKGDRSLVFKTMTTDNFAEVSAWADIIYLPGGEPFVLIDKIKASGDIAKLWDGKVIAGSSAGADLFCAGFTYLQGKTFGHGLGWVQVSCIPHWRAEDFNGYTPEDWDWAEQESLRQLPDVPVLCLPESEFIEFTVK